MKYGKIEDLPVEDQDKARIAAQAKHDCWYGGTTAQQMAEGDEELEYVVNYIYTHYNGHRCYRYEPIECPECGRVCLGADAAYACCTDLDDFYDECECDY